MEWGLPGLIYCFQNRRRCMEINNQIGCRTRYKKVGGCLARLRFLSYLDGARNRSVVALDVWKSADTRDSHLLSW